MTIKKKFAGFIAAVMTGMMLFAGQAVYAADKNWDEEIAVQEAKLQEMREQKRMEEEKEKELKRKQEQEEKELKDEIKTLRKEIKRLTKENSKQELFDARAAYDALAQHMNEMTSYYENIINEMRQGRMAQETAEEAVANEREAARLRLEAIRERRRNEATVPAPQDSVPTEEAAETDPPEYDLSEPATYVPSVLTDTDESAYYRPQNNTGRFLVNPGPSAQVSYTQDAVNAQGNSTMVFKYASNQIYKIYCRPGFLTDLSLKKGEKIEFVGGGDSSAWAISDTVVDGVPHLYIKPVVDSSTTNLIVTTNKHSYHILLNTTDDWYNPMVCWNYDGDRNNENLLNRERFDRASIDTVGTNPENLHFKYSINGKGKEIIARVFDDGRKTWIQFKGKPNESLPPLFVRQNGGKARQLVNYRIKENYYIVDTVFDVAELNISDGEIVKIKRKK